MKKVFSSIFAVLLCCSSLFLSVGCGPSEPIDSDKTQIYVSVQDLGVGNKFMDSLKTKYEEYNPKAQIMVIPGGTNDVASEIANGGYDVYMFANADINKYVNVGKGTSEYFVDISDIVTEDDNSIHDRLFDSFKSYYNVGTDDSPKYFSLPWFSAYYGTVYDVDLFEKNHYYSTDSESGLIYEGYDGVSGTEDDNWGPDGKENTFDDGLPGTYGDLKKLLLVMKEDVTPFCWTSYSGYVQSWLSYVWASYEGQNYTLMTDFNGTYYSTNADPVVIDNSNGYLTAYQNGKYAAIKVAEDIIAGGYYLPSSINTSQDNIMAQTSYLKSVEGKPVAFLMEGTWWENEAKAVFDEMATNSKPEYAYGTRRFGYMPFPRFVGSGLPSNIPTQWNDKVSIRGGEVGSETAMVAINKKSEHIDIAKDFVKFAYSEAMCADFNMISGCSRPIEYSMTDEQLSQMTYYQRQIYEITQLSRDPNSNIEIVTGLNRGKHIVKDPNFIEELTTFVALKQNSNTITIDNPFEHFITSGAMTSDEYFGRVKDYITKEKWDFKFGSL